MYSNKGYIIILFLEDWAKHPEAIIDLKTSSTTALEISALLKNMGIANHSFMLALHDVSLQGVDPFDPDITQETIIKIVQECNINPWYYFRELAYGPASSGTEPIKFRFNRANLALFWLFFNHITTMLIQPRQTGKSFSTDTLMNALLAVVTKNTKFMLLTKDDALRVANVTRLKDIYEELPPYLQLKTRGDSNNTEKITVNALGNTYTTSVAQASIKGALKLGRGSTLAIIVIDEIAFISNIEYTLPAMLAASGAARDEAARVNEPYGNIFTTTAGYLNSKEGKYVYTEVYQKATKWTEKFYDSKNEEELGDVVYKNSPGKKKMVLLEFNHRQLGYTDEWLRGKIADAMASGDAILADFLNIWVEGNEQSPIDKSLLKILTDSVVNEPYSEISKYGYITRWYLTEEYIKNTLPTRKVIMSLDTSDAVGKDDIAMTLRDIKTGATLAVGQYNETNLITFSEWLVDWIVEYPELTMIIERRSSGVAIIDNLLKILPMLGIDPFKRLFNWVVDEALEYPKRAEEVFGTTLERRDPHVYTLYRKQFGYATSASGRASREALYGNSLLSSIKYTGNKTRDKQLVEQIAGLTVRNGRIDHKSGSKDDLVISWVLGYWFLTSGRNKEYYGIQNSIVLSTVINNELTSNGTKDKLAMQEYQSALKEHIDSLVDILREEKNPMKSIILSNKIKHLYKDIDTRYIQSVNIDGVLESIKIDKEKNKHRR